MAQTVDPGRAQRAPTGYQKPAGAPAGGRGAGGVVGTSRRQGSRLTPYLFVAPYLVLFFTFVLLPAVYGIWISLHDWDFTLPRKPFVGLGNYTGLFHADYVYSRPFWDAMKATGIFTLFSVPLLLVVPLLVALVMNQRFRGRNFFRALYFAPYVLGVAVVSVLWRYLLDTNVGLINYYLDKIGIDKNIPWITSLPWAWVALIGVTVWWTLGFNAVIYLAGLQDIPRELYEAAKVDGANAWQSFRNVTLPGLRPVLLFIVSTTIIASANMFGQSYVMTRGGPGNETRTAIYYIADTGLRNFQMGAASAMSFILTLLLALVSVGVFFLFREKRSA
jgi:multiple sugar transport system permease protein